jgi:hypothetical protein
VCARFRAVRPLVLVVADLDEVRVGVAQVDAQDRTGRPCPWHRALDKRHAVRLQLLDHGVQRRLGDKAQVRAPGCRPVGLRFELAASRMQVDLAAAEDERLSTRAELDGSHAEHPRVEVDRRVDVPHCQHQVVESVDEHERTLSPVRANLNPRVPIVTCRSRSSSTAGKPSPITPADVRARPMTGQR